MKISIGIILISFLPFCSIAQKLSEGHIQYSIEITTTDTSLQARQNIGLMYDSKMELYFANDLSKVIFKMGQMYTNTIIIDKSENKALILTESPMGNYAQPQLASNFNNTEKEKDSLAKIQLVDEYKTILGYKCQKVLYSSHGASMIYWICKDITIDPSFKNALINTDLPGFPMEFIANDSGMIYTYKLSNIEFEIANKKSTFSTLIPPGYTLTGN